jgi:hypothetical protein
MADQKENEINHLFLNTASTFNLRHHGWTWPLAEKKREKRRAIRFS